MQSLAGTGDGRHVRPSDAPPPVFVAYTGPYRFDGTQLV
jgi:hypothetical protein